jgi:membrane protease YdiL (CAAX protease family)
MGAGLIVYGELTQIILRINGMSLGDISTWKLDEPRQLNVLKFLQAVSSVIIFMLTSMVFALFTFRFKHYHYLGFRKIDKPVFLIYAILLTCISFPLVAWLGELNQHVPLSKSLVDSEKEINRQLEAFLSIHHPYDTIINLLLIALLPAICEELFFRGVMQRILIFLFKSPWQGILVTAALFSAFHFEFSGFFPRMFLGIILGALYWYGNSLWPVILSHFLFNGLQVIAAEYFAPSLVDTNPHVPWAAALLSGLAVAGLLFNLRRISSVRYSQVYETSLNGVLRSPLTELENRSEFSDKRN